MSDFSNNFFLKDGYNELGPFSADELKAKGITSFSLVRREGTKEWKSANEVQELRSLFKRKNTWMKWAIGIILVLVLGIVILANWPRRIHSRNSDYQVEENAKKEIVIPPPPRIDVELSSHKKKALKELFKACNLSGDKQQLVNSCNYTNAVVRNQAVSLAGKNEGEFNLGQVCDIFDYCYSNWKYVNDSKKNATVEFASNTLQNGMNGDCDDFAVLVCSMILAIGGEARINYAYNEESGHAFTEVNIGKTEVHEYLEKRYASVYNGNGIYMRSDDQGNNWLNLDWFAKHPGGDYFDYKTGTTFYLIQEYCEDF